MSKPDPVAGGEEGFVSRWSRRKHADRTGASDEVAADQDAASSAVGVPAADIEDDLPGDEDMPSIESLDEDSDYSGFMSPKVSDGLRTLALRKLFGIPMFNVRDGLDDYDDDFTSFAKLGDIVTAEMRRQMAGMKDALQEDAPTEPLQTADADVLAVDPETSTPIPDREADDDEE